MLTILFLIIMVAVFGKLIGLAMKMTWGILKIVMTFIFLPIMLVGLLFAGLISIAFPILIVVGLVSLFVKD